MLQYSPTDNVSDASLTDAPLQLVLLATSGNRATIVIDQVFLTTYDLSVKDPELVTIGTLKKVIYDEWIAHIDRLAVGDKPPTTKEGETESTLPVAATNANTVTNSAANNSAATPETTTFTTLDPKNNSNASQPFEALAMPLVSSGSLANLIAQYPMLEDDEENSNTNNLTSTGNENNSLWDTAEFKPDNKTQPEHQSAITDNNKVSNNNSNTFNSSTEFNSNEKTYLENEVGRVYYTTEWADILAKNVSPPPTSPEHIRLIHFGRVLNDESTMEECNFLVHGSSSNESTNHDTNNNNINKEHATVFDDPNLGIATTDTAATSLPNSTNNSSQQPAYVIHMSVRPPSEVSSSKRQNKTNKKNRNSFFGSNASNNVGGHNTTQGNSRNEITDHDNEGRNSQGSGRNSHSSSRTCCIIC